MGIWQCMGERFNGVLGCSMINELPPDLVEKLGVSGPIDEFLLDSGICANNDELQVLKGWPDGTKDVLRAVIRSAVHRERRVPLSLSWAPGYDFEVTVWESRGAGEFPGGLTVLIRTPYLD